MFRWLSGLRVALRSIVRRNRVEQELNEEIQFHLDRQVAEGVQAGLTPEDARFEALRSMGPIERSKEECRDVRGSNFIDHLMGDLRFAARGLRRSPGFAVLAILIMALGIGANTAVFSIVNAVLLKPLPYDGADRIVTLSSLQHKSGERSPLVAIANFRDWRDQSSTFDAMSAYRPGESPVSPGDTAEYARTATVDGQFFRVFGVDAVIGRATADEEIATGTRVAVVSYAYWQSRLNGDRRVLERTLRVGDSRVQIIGVLPPSFRFPGETDVWLPVLNQSTTRTSHNLFAVGRLKATVSLEQAQSELTTIAAGLERQYPDSNSGRGVASATLQDSLVRDVRLTLYLLWGVVGVVLLIACANTATLLLGRATTRTREIAVRAALGANRRRIVRQLITESLFLAVLAGVSGMLLAYWGSRVLVAWTPSQVVRQATPSLDGGVLAFTLVMTVVTCVLFGLLPAWQGSRVDFTETIKTGGTRGVMGGRPARTRGGLVVAEIALAVELLIGAGLLVKSLIALRGVPLGFQPQNVLVMKATGIRSRQETNAFFAQAMTRIAELPGVTAVGATSIPPGDLSNAGDGAFFIDRIPERRDRTVEPRAMFSVVAPGTFAALGIPLERGRDFDAGDTEEQPLVAIVNQALVRRAIGEENPIGRTIFCSFDRKEGMTIIGVVGDVRQRDPSIAPWPECYMPNQQHSYNGRTLNIVARTVGDPLALASALRRVAAEVSPQIPVSFTTMEDVVSSRVQDPQFRTLLFGLFAALAVSLALAGVYGVMAYAVEQRSKEIGLRMALGASQSVVLRLVLGQGLVLTVAGLSLGLVGALVLSQLLTTTLFEVKPVDLQVYLAVAALLAFGTMVAAYLPARRAAVVDPVKVLKND